MDDKTFEDTYRSVAARASTASSEHEHVLHEALGMSDALTDDELHGIAAFQWGDRVVLRRSVSVNADVLAHELAHAAAHARFDLSRFKLVQDDELFARVALVEGEAELTRMAVAAQKEGTSLASKVTDELHASDFFDDWYQVAGAYPLADFEYKDGLRFVLALYSAGGFALVDEAFIRPPVSSSQVIHPQKYAAGVLPWRVAPVVLPDGVTELSTGTLGEEGLALWLGQYYAYDNARTSASGWLTDRYTIVRVGDGKPALVLSLVMEHENQAIAMAEAITRADPETRVTRHGIRLGITRGLVENHEALALAALDEKLEDLPDIPLPTRPVLHPVERPERMEIDTKIALPALGLVAPVPAGYYCGHMAAPLAIRQGRNFGLIFDFATTAPEMTGTWDEKTRSKVFLPIGEGTSIDGTYDTALMRRYDIAACGGRTSLHIVVLADSEAGRHEMDLWVYGLKRAREKGMACPH